MGHCTCMHGRACQTDFLASYEAAEATISWTRGMAEGHNRRPSCTVKALDSKSRHLGQCECGRVTIRRDLAGYQVFHTSLICLRYVHSTSSCWPLEVADGPRLSLSCVRPVSPPPSTHNTAPASLLTPTHGPRLEHEPVVFVMTGLYLGDEPICRQTV